MSEAMGWMLVNGLWETVVMTFVSGFFGFLIGLPTGVVLFLTRKGRVLENRLINRSVSVVVNIFRNIPFIILIFWMIPFTRALVGTSIGLWAALVPLSVGAAPFVSRIVQNRLLEEPNRLIEAAKAMGATPVQILGNGLLPEALH